MPPSTMAWARARAGKPSAGMNTATLVRAEVARAPRGGRRGPAQDLGVAALLRAEAHDHHPGRGNAAARVEVRDLARLALELLGPEHGGEEAVELLVERDQLRRGAGGSGIASKHQHVGPSVHRAPGLESKLHRSRPP